MLAINAAEIRPLVTDRPPPGPITDAGGDPVPPDGDTRSRTPREVLLEYTVDARLEQDSPIDTRNPMENAAVLRPKSDLERTACDGPPVGDADGPRCYRYRSRLYADYNATNETAVSVRVAVEGSNARWVYGWSGNWFSDAVSVTIHGDRDGWVNATGRVRTGEGSY
jgi:hypothetical protein